MTTRALAIRLMMAALMMAALVLPPSVAHAAPSGPDADWRIRLELGTAFPLQVGASVVVQGPAGLRIHSGLGTLPGGYLDTINAVANAFDWYDELTGALISAALSNSLIWDTKIGWQPWSSVGFYVVGGYSLIALGGGLTTAETVSVLTEKSLPPSVGASRELQVGAVVHQLKLELGWDWLLTEHLTLRAALGGAFTLGSSTELMPSWEPKPKAKPAVDQMMVAGQDYLDDIFQSYVHTAYLSLCVGWRW